MIKYSRYKRDKSKIGLLSDFQIYKRDQWKQYYLTPNIQAFIQPTGSKLTAVDFTGWLYKNLDILALDNTKVGYVFLIVIVKTHPTLQKARSLHTVFRPYFQNFRIFSFLGIWFNLFVECNYFDFRHQSKSTKTRNHFTLFLICSKLENF